MSEHPHSQDITGVSITRVEAFGPMSEELLKDLPQTVQEQVREAQEQGKLTQFLGVALRGVLPYAEQEVRSIHEVARRDNDEEARAEAVDGDRVLARARVALDRLNDTSATIADLDDDVFDDDFQVNFEDDETETR